MARNGNSSETKNLIGLFFGGIIAIILGACLSDLPAPFPSASTAITAIGIIAVAAPIIVIVAKASRTT